MKIEIAVAIDKSYLQHFYVLLESIKKYKSPYDFYMINVMHSNLENQDIAILKNNYKCVFDFNFYNMRDYQLDDLYINAHVTTETYYRILLPNILPQALKKVLYLDCDLIVNHNLAELWNYGIESSAVGAVFDYKAQFRKDELNIPINYDYFNAGVLLINLDYWRKHEFVQKLLQFIRENPDKLLYWDQDALNALMYNKVTFLPVNWNVQSVMFELSEQDRKLVEAKKNPYIIHFTGATKPWHISSNNPYKFKYLNYLERTPYVNYDQPNEVTRSLIKYKKNIFIWGAGPTGENVFKYLDIDIKGFVDSDSSKWGTYFMDKKIFSIHEIKEIPSLGIIICSGYYREIANVLENLGFIEGENFVHQM